MSPQQNQPQNDPTSYPFAQAGFPLPVESRTFGAKSSLKGKGRATAAPRAKTADQSSGASGLSYRPAQMTPSIVRDIPVSSRPTKTKPPQLPYWEGQDEESRDERRRAQRAARASGHMMTQRRIRPPPDIRILAQANPENAYRVPSLAEVFKKESLAQRATKAARKTPAIIDLVEDEASDSDNISDASGKETPEDSDIEEIRFSETVDDITPLLASSPARPSIVTPTRSVSPKLPDDLVEDLAHFTLTTHLGAPFLPRNVRKGFLLRCQQRRVSLCPSSKQRLRVVITKSGSSSVHKTDIENWFCPLCDIHGNFRNIDMLQKHLEWDHDDVQADWRHQGSQTQSIECILKLTLPAIEKEPPAAAPSLPIFRQPKAEPEEPTLPPMMTEEEEATISVPSTPRMFNLNIDDAPDSRYPCLPPRDDPDGPAARRPFLPARSEYGGPDIMYSSRPGGPRIFDLLGTLPTQPYGVLLWDVIDREEEIFESDDSPDETKVITALWARWIFLNRNEFISNYYLGVKQFIDDYWKMIHRAAGWRALRLLLLILLANRLLTGKEVADVLNYYDKKTNREEWDKMWDEQEAAATSRSDMS